MKARIAAVLSKLLIGRFALLALAIPLAAPAARADTDAMAEFRFQGIPLGAECHEFLRRFPSAMVHEKSEEAVGFQVYSVAATVVADLAEFKFLDGRLFQINVVYLPGRLDNLGGVDVVVAKLGDAFGYANETKPIQQGTAAIWRRPDISRTATFGAVQGAAMLIVTDTSVESELRSRRAKTANLGF